MLNPIEEFNSTVAIKKNLGRLWIAYTELQGDI